MKKKRKKSHKNLNDWKKYIKIINKFKSQNKLLLTDYSRKNTNTIFRRNAPSLDDMDTKTEKKLIKEKEQTKNYRSVDIKKQKPNYYLNKPQPT